MHLRSRRDKQNCRLTMLIVKPNAYDERLKPGRLPTTCRSGGAYLM